MVDMVDTCVNVQPECNVLIYPMGTTSYVHQGERIITSVEKKIGRRQEKKKKKKKYFSE